MLRAGLVFLLLTIAHGEDLKDIEYGRARNVSLRFDAHIPDGSGPFAAVILVHGGAWVTGDKANSVWPLLQPLTSARFAWFSISYRLAGDVARNPVGAAMQLGTAENDVRRAVAFVKQHAEEYRVNRDRIALLGESAGGQLASMAALRPDPDSAVKGVVAFYTPSDLKTLAQTSNLILDRFRDALKGTLLDDLLLAGLSEFSPINAVSASSPPFLLIHGTDDSVVPLAQSERFCDKLQSSGVNCEIYTVKGGGHGMRGWESMRLTDYKSAMVAWLERLLTAK